MGPLRVMAFLESHWSVPCIALTCTSRMEWTSAPYPGFFASLWPRVFYLELSLVALWCIVILPECLKSSNWHIYSQNYKNTHGTKSKRNHRCVFISIIYSIYYRISILDSKCSFWNWSSQSSMICHCECLWNIYSYSAFPDLMAVSGKAWINQAHVSTDSNGSLSALKCGNLPLFNSFNR